MTTTPRSLKQSEFELWWQVIIKPYIHGKDMPTNFREFREKLFEAYEEGWSDCEAYMKGER